MALAMANGMANEKRMNGEWQMAKCHLCHLRLCESGTRDVPTQKGTSTGIGKRQACTYVHTYIRT